MSVKPKHPMKAREEAMYLIDNVARAQETISKTIYVCRFKNKLFQSECTYDLRCQLEKAITTYRRWGRV